MKKTLLTFALAVAGIFAFNAAAQTTANTTEQTAKECKADFKGKACDFADLNLNETQKQSVKALNEKYFKEMKEAKKAAKADKEKKKEDKAQKMKNRREQRKAYLKELQKILTPEQYTTYLENQYLNGKNFGCGKDRGKGDRKDFQKKNAKKGMKDLKKKEGKKPEKQTA